MKSELRCGFTTEYGKEYGETYEALASIEAKRPRFNAMRRLRAEEVSILGRGSILGDSFIDKYCIEVGHHLVPLALPLDDRSVRTMIHNKIQIGLNDRQDTKPANGSSISFQDDVKSPFFIKGEVLSEIKDFLRVGKAQIDSESEKEPKYDFKSWTTTEYFVSYIKSKLRDGVTYDELIKQGLKPETLKLVRKILNLKQDEFPPKDRIIY